MRSCHHRHRGSSRTGASWVAAIPLCVILLVPIVIQGCRNDSKEPITPAWPLVIPVESVSGKYHFSQLGSDDPSPYYVEVYQDLRERAWNLFVADPGEPWHCGYIGQVGMAYASKAVSADEWWWSIDYQGWESEFAYSLPSKAGYSRATIAIALSKDEFADFVPYDLEIRSYGYEVLFQTHVDEDFPFYPLNQPKEFELSPFQFAYLPIGQDIPLYVTTNTFRTSNPLPEEPSGDQIRVSSVGGIGLYFTLYP